MSSFHNLLESTDKKRKVIISMLLDESFEIEYFENGKLIHSYEAVNKPINQIYEIARQFVNYENSPVLLEG